MRYIIQHIFYIVVAIKSTIDHGDSSFISYF